MTLPSRCLRTKASSPGPYELLPGFHLSHPALVSSSSYVSSDRVREPGFVRSQSRGARAILLSPSRIFINKSAREKNQLIISIRNNFNIQNIRNKKRLSIRNDRFFSSFAAYLELSLIPLCTVFILVFNE